MQRAVQHLRETGVPHAESLRCPAFLDFVLGADLDQACEAVAEQLGKHGLGYPFVIKLLQASRTTHAHSFFVVNGPAGLREALAFEGFQGQHLLLQEWLQHHEQLYKLYCVGPARFDYVIKPSIPQSAVEASPAFFFQTRMKFEKAAYTGFDLTPRIPEEVFAVIARDVAAGYFGLNLTGIDILI